MRLVERGEAVLVSTFLLCCVALVSSRTIQKREISADGLLQDKVKRPFCNAFTGCGRKRSDPTLEMALQSALAGAGGAEVAPPLMSGPGAATGDLQRLVAARTNERLYEDLLARLQALREQQMLSGYVRSKRSVSAGAEPAPAAAVTSGSNQQQEPKPVTKR